ncbi:MAG: hypothetical protein U0791_20985 [Gemmataceae bacterium]
MNRDLGAKPDPSLGSLSAFDWSPGWPMMNLSRLPRMQFAKPPIEYPFATYKADPRLALNPKPSLTPASRRRSWASCVFLATVWRLEPHHEHDEARSRDLRRAIPEDDRAGVPGEARDASPGRCRPGMPSLVETSNRWIEAGVLVCRESLKPTVFADYCWSALVEMLKPKLGLKRRRRRGYAN